MDTSLNYGISIATLETVEPLRHRTTYHQDWHVHPRALEIHCVLSGTLSYEFGDTHPPVSIPGGSFLTIPAGIHHRAVNAEGAPTVRLVTRWLQSLAHLPKGPCPFSARELKSLLAATVASPFEARRMPPRLQRATRELFRAVEERDEPHFQRLAAWSFLAELALAARQGEPVPSTTADVVGQLCAWIRAHCGERLRMQDFVRISGYSERQLFTLFRERVGLSPGNFLTRCRIDHAKDLMSTTPPPRLLDVALACGFSSPSHFSAVFRQYEGDSPSTIRKRA